MMIKTEKRYEVDVKFKIINPCSRSLTTNETKRIVCQKGFVRKEFAGLDVLMDLDDLKGYDLKNDSFCLSNGLSKVLKMYLEETPEYTFVLDMVSDKLSAIDKALYDELELIKKSTPKQSSGRGGLKIS